MAASSSAESTGTAVGGSIGDGAGSDGVSPWVYVVVGAVALTGFFLWLKFRK